MGLQIHFSGYLRSGTMPPNFLIVLTKRKLYTLILYKYVTIAVIKDN